MAGPEFSKSVLEVGYNFCSLEEPEKSVKDKSLHYLKDARDESDGAYAAIVRLGY